ncbi:MAG: penicillin-insensitive murein endopeptidase, partial [Bdellovibrionales bacterium]|nr:penicillin-insensitive murein endopeptidase [Bdellovibrionales bacterium]
SDQLQPTHQIPSQPNNPETNTTPPPSTGSRELKPKNTSCDEFRGCSGEYVGYPVSVEYYSQMQDWRSPENEIKNDNDQKASLSEKTPNVKSEKEAAPVEVLISSRGDENKGRDNKIETPDDNPLASQMSENNPPTFSTHIDGNLIVEEDLRLGARSVGLPFSANRSSGSIREDESGPNFLSERGGLGYRLLNIGRRQNFGSGFLIRFLEKTSQIFQNNLKDSSAILVNAISKKGGGVLGRHSSHQNGLDVDIAYIGESQFASVIDRNGRLKNDFDLDLNFQYFKLLVDTGYVNRIFIDRRIKNKFCERSKKRRTFEKDSPVLTKLRPYRGHHNHFHLRLVCSPFHSMCRNQVLPVGTGCS